MEGIEMKIYKKRIKNIKEKISKTNIDYIILTPSTNMKYLTGFDTESHERLLACIISSAGESILLGPELNKKEMKKTPIDKKIYWQESENPLNILINLTKEIKSKNAKIGIEKGATANLLLPLQEKLNSCSFEFIDDIFSKMRLIKSDKEKMLLKKASQIAEKALEITINSENWIGKSEKELAAKLEYNLKKQGMSGTSFKTIVGSGPHGASPHHNYGDRLIKESESVVIDFGGIYKGYCSDMTRTFSFGKPSSKLREVFKIVKNSQELAEEKIKPGMKAEEVDKITRDYINKNDYGEYFIHRTGHGIGMDVHEKPFIVQGNKEVLKPGMVFSVEPGIYLPNEFGVRIEDLVLITDNGCESLNKFTKNTLNY